MTEMRSEDVKITFFDNPRYSDRKEALEPIAEAAAARGLDVSWTTEFSDSAEIGFYNEHPSKIESVNADTACVLFHGIDDELQSGWLEGWNRFDIGFVSGEVAASNWKQDSWMPEARPTVGVFPVGWPKSDRIFSDHFENEIEELKSGLGLRTGFVLLYAPSTKEADEKKIREYIDATDAIGDHLLIKQHPAVTEPIPQGLVDEVESNQKITVIDPQEEIINYLAVADVLITDESSVSLEAPLTNTVPISVVDWPSWGDSWDTVEESTKELPESAIRTTRDELSNTVRHVLENYEKHIQRSVEFRKNYFNNQGNSAEKVIDIVMATRSSDELPTEPIQPKRTPILTRTYMFTTKKFIGSLSEDTEKRLQRLQLHRVKRKFDGIIKKYSE